MTILFSFHKDPKRLSNLPKVIRQHGDLGCSVPQPRPLLGTPCLTEGAERTRLLSVKAAGGGRGGRGGLMLWAAPQSVVHKVGINMLNNV